MSVNRNSSIHILLGLLIIVGVLIFIFRANILTYISNQVFGTGNLLVDTVDSPSASSDLDADLLDRLDFQKLSDQIFYFDFNVIGKPSPKKDYLVTPNWPTAYQGNFNPFFQKKIQPKEEAPQ